MTNLISTIKEEKRSHARLSDFIKIKHGFAFKGEDFSSSPTKDILVTPGNFAIGGGFKDEKLKYYKGSVPTEYILKPGDLVVTMTDLSVNTDTLGYSALVPNNPNYRFLHNQRIGLVQKVKEGVDLVYLNYLMRTREYQSHVVSSASGSTVRHTSPDRISGYEYDFPSLQTQRKIAEILSVYDAKIENNKSIIRNLQLMAQTLFNEWFVEFRFPGYERIKFIKTEFGEVPENWTVLPLDEVADFLNGVASQKYPPIAGESSLPIIKIREINSGIDENTERANTKIDPKYIVKNDDILFSWSGSLELIAWSGGDGFLNQHIFKVTSETYPKWFYFYSIKKHLQHFRAIASGKATTMGHIQRHHLTETKIVVPNSDVLKKADALMSKLFSEESRLRLENVFLAESRDRLLAKLI
jgi:type I restriction enzyme, S subunit